MAQVTITNLGGSINIVDTRFSPELTNLTVLKDGLSIKRFGNIVRLTLKEGNWLDIDYTEVNLINFTYSTLPSDSEEFYDELWKILEDYCDCGSILPEPCYRQLEDGSSRLLEDSSPRLLEEDCSSGGGGGVWGSITGTLSDQTDLQSALDLKANLSGATFTGLLEADAGYDFNATGIQPSEITHSGSGDLNIAHSGSGDIVISTSGSGTILQDATDFQEDITVPDEAYGAGWNGSLEVPTKNAIYDKIETLNPTRVLLSEQTASSSATIDFAGLFSSDYQYYEVVYFDVVPVTNASDFVLRIGTGATPTYKSGATDYSHHRLITGPSGTGTSTVNTAVGDGNDTEIVIYGAAISNTPANGISGTLRIINPLGTTTYCHLFFEMELVTTAGSTYRVNGGGYYLATTAVTALRFFSNTGNISTGTFRLYGIK